MTDDQRELLEEARDSVSAWKRSRTMNATPIKPWLENVQLHPDVLSETFSEDIFALDLGPLADCWPGCGPVWSRARGCRAPAR